MHILKKIKKRFGLVRRNFTCLNSTNLPPLQFHNVHGTNIRISRDGTLARRFESFCRAITFSSRPVRINERICLKFSETSNNWNGGIRFGFTNHDPVTLNHALPKYVCPDLTNRPGFWAKALHEQYCEKNNILTFYVNSVGDVVYSINNEEKGVILSGIDTRGLLWAIFDIYGNCTSIEFVNFNNYSIARSHNVLNSNETNENFLSSMHSLKISKDVNTERKQETSNRLVPMTFHSIKGRNIILSNDNLVATRKSNDFCQGYVFSSHPIIIGEEMTVQILEIEYRYCGTLALGLTSCNPLELLPSDLPDDSDYLLDRPEYWVLSKDIASKSRRGDEITFFIGLKGEVSIKINNDPAYIVMHVDQSLKLWAFFDIYGSTKSIRVFKCESKISPCNDIENQVLETYTRIQKIHTSEIESPNAENQDVQNAVTATSNNDVLRFHLTSKSNNPSNTVLSVNLSTATKIGSNINNSKTTDNSCRTISQKSPSTQDNPVINFEQWKENKNHILDLLECTICYENTIDSVLYACGHMCMCFECAIEQWHGSGGGQCPLCRATIRDVIRTYVT